MVDKLIIEAQLKLSDFANEWQKRARELQEEGRTSYPALKLADDARKMVKKLDELLMVDKELDKEYDKAKMKKSYS